MDKENFEILLTKYEDGNRKKYKMQVEIFHRSEQVIRFRVFAGKKEMILEKLVTKHKGQWKIKEMNFEFSGNLQEVTRSVMDIQDEIDYYLRGRPKSVSKYQKNVPDKYTDKIPVSFDHHGKIFSGHFEKIVGSGEVLTWYLIKDDGRNLGILRKDSSNAWVFDESDPKEELKYLARFFGNYIFERT
ncbi:MAG: hypothetical protein ABI675_21025 [Chitinophagaceae bacterium]